MHTQLQSRETGEVFNIASLDYTYSVKAPNAPIELVIEKDGKTSKYGYDSLSGLLTDWIMLEQTSIPDEKVREVVRAWSELSKDDCFYVTTDNNISDGSGYNISFPDDPFKEMEKRHYTRSELFGDNEQPSESK